MALQDGDGRLLATLAMVTQLGFIMAASILAGFLAGLYLDRYLSTSPVFTIVLLLGGVAGGTIAAYRMIMQSLEEPGGEDQSGRDEDEERTETSP
ncbi:MAG: AtpZ/AtpI family protein [Planctomycetota bacterium]